MRPSVEEQLLGSCRILETVVAPCVGDPLARTVLDNLVANLRMLTAALPKVAGFVRDDNAATTQLLQTLRAALPADLAGRIAAATHAQPGSDDEPAQDERNRLLRGLLAEAVCSPALTPALRAATEQHMINRASRVPMRYVPTVAPPSTARP